MSDPTDSLPPILAGLEQLQAKKAALRESLRELQFAIPNPPPPVQEPYHEPKVCLLDKFNGTRS